MIAGLPVMTWALGVLLLVAVVLVGLTLIGERDRGPAPKVRVALHSLEDAQGRTQALTPPPELRYGGVVGRPRVIMLDGEETPIRPTDDRV